MIFLKKTFQKSFGIQILLLFFGFLRCYCFSLLVFFFLINLFFFTMIIAYRFLLFSGQSSTWALIRIHIPPFEPSPHFLGWYRVPVWVSWAIWYPVGSLYFTVSLPINSRTKLFLMTSYIQNHQRKELYTNKKMTSCILKVWKLLDAGWSRPFD